ncbi:hypothetical protein OG889_01745 [Streptomyces sp. NBC_00481]|uniref:hypothetical protein n=1 Tax=unclassified Streptomyces TaxID=2593676 RepID=UPI002DDB102A|nr:MULTISPECIES: hypothetical protein [unclassified Streptomyces]WRY93549.1 hypothetical protein OG889_01745 [Streptomyces sp. NBC_00481]
MERSLPSMCCLAGGRPRRLCAVREVADEVFAACFSALPDADRATLLDLLQRFTAERDT